MSERIKTWLIVASMVVLTVAISLMISTEPADANRAEAIGTQIKCPVCQGESIADSPAQMARDMMALVDERIDGGATDDQIIDELLASFSGAVLLDPPTSGSTLLLWLLPLGALIAGVAVILWWKRHPGSEDDPPATPGRGRTRLAIGGILLVGAFAAIVAVAAVSLQEGPAASTGVADLSTQDLDDVSNETMEAVVAANTDHPQVNGMRLALAERYYQGDDYRSAFPHYLAVAESSAATGPEMVTSLVRLGWMAYDGNGEVDTALTLFDEALEIDPASQVAVYLKGQVLWCGVGDSESASILFNQLLELPNLPDDSRKLIEADLAQASQGVGCA